MLPTRCSHFRREQRFSETWPFVSGLGGFAYTRRRKLLFFRNVTKQGLSERRGPKKLSRATFSSFSETSRAKNDSPANVSETSRERDYSEDWARLHFPSRGATRVTLPSLSIKPILSSGKATFLSDFNAKARRKAPAEVFFSFEELQKFSETLLSPRVRLTLSRSRLFSLEECERFSLRGLCRPP